ncbi:LysM peptidoglycan-binding domain-containing protein [Nostocoides sp. F2B08]|uniref:LysM peptidoglycan-binding domain-containing protein n=1 Tax=Nostocoides sp. F2B08 TaxID=2653936 RepID=UPI001D0402FB|nr:LysM peptidoglycan-binding domain-containing protein [Tetrasphaera sp. F2B08]
MIRRRLLGLLALLLILGIVIGLPIVLVAVGANPFTSGVPSLDELQNALTSPDDGTLAVAVIKVVAWASWAFLTVSILLEVLARLRGVRAPRLPGLSLPQNAARGLVGTALTLFVAFPAAGAAHAAPVTAIAATHITATVSAPAPLADPATHTGDPDTSISAQSAQQNTEPPQTVHHTVKRGETLWSIAADRLGDGHRYKEIHNLNREILGDQPGFIKAGWVLDIPTPDPAAQDGAADTVVVEKGDTLSEVALEQYGDATRYPEIFEASRSITQPGGAQLTDPDVIDVGWTLKIPGAATPSTTHPELPDPVTPQPQSPSTTAPAEVAAPATGAPSAPTPEAPETAPPATQAQPQAPTGATVTTPDHLQSEPPWMARTSYGVGALLAAGVIALLATKRRTQQRRRSPGQRMPMPTGAAARAEQELRATADALSIETVDVALRTLARSCADNGVALPAVRAARLTATQFDLYLAEPADLPAPWTGTADDTVWTLEVDNTFDLAEVDVADIPAPYPALVTIGHDEEEGHVLLDLEFLGTLGVIGQDAAATREILAALAIELANSTWADDLQVTLVGAFPDLEDTLQTGRIRYLPSVGRLLEDLLHRAELDRQAMSAHGASDLHHARVTGAAPDVWAPEIVLLAGEITDRQRNQLEQLVTDLPRVAMAMITNGLTVGEWGLDLTAGDGPEYAVLTPIGLQLRPQRLPAEQYGHLLEIASLADIEELDPTQAAPLPSLAEVESITPNNEPATPVSAMPEITLDHLEAVTRETSATAPTLDPASLHDQRPQTSTSGSIADDIEETISARQPHATEDAFAAEDDLSPQPPLTDPPTADPPPADPTTAPTTPVADTEPELTAEAHVAPGTSGEEDDAHALDHAVPPAQVHPMPIPAPRIVVLGPVDLLNATGKVEPTKRSRLLEYAAYLSLTPGTTHTAIDNAIWPDRKNEDNLNTRNTATSKLRRWVGTDPVSGAEYLPRIQAGEGYAFHPAVTTDVGDWEQLLGHDPLNATTERLEEALALVRGIPFEGTHRKRYAWAEPIRQRLISEIVDASYELARRRLMDGRWRGAEEAVVVGLRIEPAQENLWRLRILAAHESRNTAAETEAIERLLTITEQLECDLEPETEQLLAALKTPGTDFDQLMANAL